ncbi:MAG: hypothetical protein R3F17_00940 [Planctomycetota bacterium]
MASKTHKHAQLPLLYFGGGVVEWVPTPGKEEHGYRRDDTQSRSAPDMVRVARGLLQETGHKPGRCQVLLGGDQVRTRMYSLGDIPAKAVRSVLRRKAANLLEVEEHQAIFSAMALTTHEGDTDRRWLVTAIRLDDLRSLQLALIKDGFRPARFLFARQALLGTADQHLSTGSDDEAWVIVGVEHEGVCISLVAGGQLVQRSLVPGQFDTHSAMAASVLQELRGFESYWRRFSRGGAIDDVLVAGLDSDELEHFELACHAALPTAEFLGVGADLNADKEGARAGYLAACAASEGQEGDCTIARPVSRGSLAGVAVMTLGIGLFGGWMLRENLEEQRRHYREGAEALAQAVPELDSIETVLDQHAGLRRELDQRATWIATVGSAGLDLHGWMAQTEAAFAGQAVLDNVHFDDTGTETSFIAGGRVDPDPMGATRALAAVRERLIEHAQVGQLQMRLPSALATGEESDSGLEFRVLGSLRSQGGNAQ